MAGKRQPGKVRGNWDRQGVTDKGRLEATRIYS
jgi:hypothetical protein